MKCKVSAVLCAAFVCVWLVAGCSTFEGTVLLLPREGSASPDYMIEKEADVMTKAVTAAGYRVRVATVSGSTIKGSKRSLRVDLKISQVKMSDYVGVLMPCMAAGGLGWHAYQEQKDIVTAANALGIPIAAQASSVIILAEAGLLVGKKYTYYSDPSYNKAFKGAVYAGSGVVRDGNIITSGNCPYVLVEYGSQNIDGTSQLTADFLKALDALHTK